MLKYMLLSRIGNKTRHEMNITTCNKKLRILILPRAPYFCLCPIRLQDFWWFWINFEMVFCTLPAVAALPIVKAWLTFLARFGNDPSSQYTISALRLISVETPRTIRPKCNLRVLPLQRRRCILKPETVGRCCACHRQSESAWHTSENF